MERNLFAVLMAFAWNLPEARRRPLKSTYRNFDVLAVALWAALHDRPISWATKRENWPFHDRTRPLPSDATMSRRLRDPVIIDLIERVRRAMLVAGDGERTLMIDGRKLCIALHSADADATKICRKRVVYKGYALHAIVDASGNCRAWRVETLNVSEQAAAKILIAELEPGSADKLLADANYDSNELYELAGRRDIQMFAARRYKNAKGVGHHWHSEHRLYALKVMKRDRKALCGRRFIESCFGTQGNVVGGLGPLPNHVRGLERVRRWVALKLAIDAAHRHLREKRRAA